MSEKTAESAERQDGGQAFPATETHPSWDYPVHHTGMTLRDWFASQALSNLPVDMFEAAMNADVPVAQARAGIAKACYQLADAMLAERAR